MKILGIDTSTSCGSVGLVEDEVVLCDDLCDLPITHSERLLASVAHVLSMSRCSVTDLDGWAVSLGPGSFTGLRIGVSVVKGLAFATGKPVAGVPTLDVLAAQVSPTDHLICPVLDARKGEIYTASYRYGKENSLFRLTPEQVIRPEVLARSISEPTILVGAGVTSYRDLFRQALSSYAIFLPSFFNVPRGSVCAKRGLDLLRKGQCLDLATFTPIYVRPSEAEIHWREKHAV